MADGSPLSSYTGRRFLLELAVGLVLGFVTWMLAGPSVVSFWYTAPSGGLSCGASVQEALSQFVRLQLWSALAGAFGLVVLLFVGRRIVSSYRKSPASP